MSTASTPTALIVALKANNCAAHYSAPQNLVAQCATDNAELISLLVVALKEACGGNNAAHDGGACNRLLCQSITGLSPEQAEA
jgi:hypothetical protein